MISFIQLSNDLLALSIVVLPSLLSKSNSNLNLSLLSWKPDSLRNCSLYSYDCLLNSSSSMYSEFLTSSISNLLSSYLIKNDKINANNAQSAQKPKVTLGSISAIA